MQEKDKNANIQTWLEGASRVWTAIMANEDLMMIQDLAEINNGKKMAKVLESYKVI